MGYSRFVQSASIPGCSALDELAWSYGITLKYMHGDKLTLPRLLSGEVSNNMRKMLLSDTLTEPGSI
jgi:hypothetical protein